MLTTILTRSQAQEQTKIYFFCWYRWVNCLTFYKHHCPGPLKIRITLPTHWLQNCRPYGTRFGNSASRGLNLWTCRKRQQQLVTVKTLSGRLSSHGVIAATSPCILVTVTPAWLIIKPNLGVLFFFQPWNHKHYHPPPISDCPYLSLPCTDNPTSPVPPPATPSWGIMSFIAPAIAAIS